MERIRKLMGLSSGRGVNHEDQSFRSEAVIDEILDGRGVQISLRVEGEDGTLLHEEETLILPLPEGGLSAWSFSINAPPVVMLECEPGGPHAEGEDLAQFSTGNLDDRDRFRQRITIKGAGDRKWVYCWEWGTPGGDFGPRSSSIFIRPDA